MNQKEVIKFLIDQYEVSLTNSSNWRKEIEDLLKNEQDERFIELINERLKAATDAFNSSLAQKSKK
jgi:hypothetical protein